jgi:hypothetical protein
MGLHGLLQGKLYLLYGYLYALAALLPEKEPLLSLGWETGWVPGSVCTRWREVSAPADN